MRISLVMRANDKFKNHKFLTLIAVIDHKNVKFFEDKRLHLDNEHAVVKFARFY